MDALVSLVVILVDNNADTGDVGQARSKESTRTETAVNRKEFARDTNPDTEFDEVILPL